MCCQPGNRTACQLQRPIHIPLLNKDATEMEPCKIRGMTQRLAARTGAGWQEHIFSFRSREQNVLYISSYRSGVYANYDSERGSPTERIRPASSRNPSD